MGTKQKADKSADFWDKILEVHVRLSWPSKNEASPDSFWNRGSLKAGGVLLSHYAQYHRRRRA